MEGGRETRGRDNREMGMERAGQDNGREGMVTEEHGRERTYTQTMRRGLLKEVRTEGEGRGMGEKLKQPNQRKNRANRNVTNKKSGTK